LRRWARQADMGSTMLMNSNIQMILCLAAGIVMCNRYYAAWPFDNQCPDPDNPGEYSLCDRWQNGLWFDSREYMNEDQVSVVQGFKLALLIVSSVMGAYWFIFESYCSIKNLFFGINESAGKHCGPKALRTLWAGACCCGGQTCGPGTAQGPHGGQACGPCTIKNRERGIQVYTPSITLEPRRFYFRARASTPLGTSITASNWQVNR
jgi:hypothetical protein